MNDNLEFRAWDKVNKHMIVDSPLSMATIMGNYVGKKIDFNGKSLVENYEIMQFIGLRDKNGKKIFAGDIVKTTTIIDGNFVQQISRRYVVVFQGCSFQYKDIGPFAHRFNPNTTTNPIGCDNPEVIGNIYENPELLEALHE